MGLKSPEIPAKRTTSAGVTVRRGLSHSSPTTKSSNNNVGHEYRSTFVSILPDCQPEAQQRTPGGWSRDALCRPPRRRQGDLYDTDQQDSTIAGIYGA